MYMIKGFLD